MMKEIDMKNKDDKSMGNDHVNVNVNVDNGYFYEFSLKRGINSDVIICDRIIAENLVDAYKKTLEQLNMINSMVISNDDKFELNSLTRI